MIDIMEAHCRSVGYQPISECPVISFGWGRPMIERMVGATSARRPGSTLASLRSVT